MHFIHCEMVKFGGGERAPRIDQTLEGGRQ